jgi:hypothetical protein
MGGAVAKARKFTLSRIRQAMDAAGLTIEQRREFLASLESKPAPKGRPSNARRALEETRRAEEEQEELEQRIAKWRASRYKIGPLFPEDPENT